MSEQKWNDAKNEVAAFRSFLSANHLPADTPRAFLLTREEIERILNQRGTDGTSLDGIRIYLGMKTVNNVQVPSVVIVGAEKDAQGGYNDYITPTTLKAFRAGASNLRATSEIPGDDSSSGDDDGSSGTIGGEVVIGNPMPCPVSCGKKNELNP